MTKIWDTVEYLTNRGTTGHITLTMYRCSAKHVQGEEGAGSKKKSRNSLPGGRSVFDQKAVAEHEREGETSRGRGYTDAQIFMRVEHFCQIRYGY